MKRLTRSDLFAKILAVVVVLAILAAVVGLSWAIRAYVPCSFFPVAEAPVRCLPGGAE